MELLQEIQRIQAIAPRDGDIIVVSVNENVTDSDSDFIGQTFRHELDERGYSKNISLIICRGDIKVEVIRKEE